MARRYIADMKKLTPHLLLCFAFLFTNYASAHCAENESSVHIVVDTDGYGYESYWELVPLDQTCGSAPVLLSGGNMDVGCNGVGENASYGYTYASNQTFVSELVCVTAGSQLDLIHVDSYGDGGADFTVLIDGMPSQLLQGSGYVCR